MPSTWQVEAHPSIMKEVSCHSGWCIFHHFPPWSGHTLCKNKSAQVYRNALVAPQDRHLLRMQCGDACYVDKTLPFGLCMFSCKDFLFLMYWNGDGMSSFLHYFLMGVPGARPTSTRCYWKSACAWAYQWQCTRCLTAL